MKFSSTQRRIARGYLHKVALGALAAAVASLMVVPIASANSQGAGVVTGNGYGMNPSKEIGENTVPSAAKGDTAFVLTSLYNSQGQRYITGCCGGSGTASCDFLDVVGIDSVGSTGYNWSTKINVNPDHFAWNDAVTDESTCTQVSGNAASAAAGIGYVKQAWCGVQTYATVEKYLPDVLASTSPSTYNTIVSMVNDDGYTKIAGNKYKKSESSGGGPGGPGGPGGGTSYVLDDEGTYVKLGSEYVELASVTKYNRTVDEAGIATYKEAADGEYYMSTEKYAKYAPKVVNMSPTGGMSLTTLSDILWTEAVAAESVEGYGTTAVARYGDPTDIAQDYEGFTKGLQWYILSKHEQDKTLKNVAYVTGYADGQVTCVATNPKRDKDGQMGVRTYEGFDQITNNIALTGSTFTQTGTYNDYGSNTYVANSLDDFAKCDVVFTGSNFDATALQAAFDAAGYKCKIVPVNLAIGNQGFGFSRNLVEYMGYLYPEDLQLSYMLKYFWSHFAHVKDQYVDAVMVDQDSTKLLPTGDAEIDLDTTGYNEYYILSRVAEGEEYYRAHMTDSNSFCSNYSLKAQGTVEANAYEFGVAAKKAEEVKPAPEPTPAKAQSLSFKSSVTKAKTLKAKKGKLAKTSTFSAAVSGAKTTTTYKLASVTKAAKKYITINSKTGKVTIKKGLKKGTFKIKVKATAKATTAYKSATKTSGYITIKVK